MAVSYGPGIMEAPSDGDMYLLQRPPFTHRVIILIKWTSEEMHRCATEFVLALREKGLLHFPVLLVRNLMADLNLCGKSSYISDGAGLPRIEDPGDPSNLPGELIKDYDSWPTKPNIRKSTGGIHLLKGYDKWPDVPNIQDHMKVKGKSEGYDIWPEEPGVGISEEVADCHEDPVTIDGDPGVWKGPSPDHRLHTRTELSRAYISQQVLNETKIKC